MSASKTSKTRPARYVPEFSGPIEGWVVNFLTRNLWRVARTMDRDDCLQEARLVFLRVRDRYPEVQDAPHFMALYKTSWTRWFDDLSSHDSRVRETEVRVDGDRASHDDEGPEFQPVGDVTNDGELQVMLRQAPREVTMVLNLLLKAPQEMLDLLLGQWKVRDRRMRANGSERINELLGLPAHYDSMGAVEDYFRPGTQR